MAQRTVRRGTGHHRRVMRERTAYVIGGLVLVGLGVGAYLYYYNKPGATPGGNPPGLPPTSTPGG